MSKLTESFTLGGQTNVELGVELLEDFDEPIAPDTRDNKVMIPGRHGEYVYDSDLESRTFKLRLSFVDTTGKMNLQAAIRTFIDHLVDVDGRPKDLELSFTKEPGWTYLVRYSGYMPIERVVHWGMFALPLQAAMPFAYADAEIDEAEITSSPQTMEVTSNGTVKTPCKIWLKYPGGATISGFTLKREVID